MVQYLKFYFSTIVFFVLVQQNYSVHRTQKSPERKSRINDEGTLRRLNQVVSDDTYLKEALHNINIPRAVGTANHTKVITYITDQLVNLGWYVETDSFSDNTPLGVKTFTNIIATPKKNAVKYLDLACHFDSKLYKDFVFYGTTDSAVPCAMMLHIAQSLDPYLKKSDNDLALRLIFFDGEEAFVSWSNKDSLYGARHLAHKWASMPYPEAGHGYTQLHKMDLLVLLDLLGAPNPKFYSFFSESLDSYKILVNAQSKLNHNGFTYPSAKYFLKKSSIDSIEDDHIPFFKRGVPVLHIIPSPFPRQWHTQYDNADAIDMRTINNLTKILTAFVAEYLELDL